MTADRLRFSTAVLRLLGEELIPYPDQGILELVKNAYDADAKQCTVELLDADHSGGSIRVRDSGRGMLPDEIRGGWLVVGESDKAGKKYSPGGRLLVGSKGLGRLAALRLGTKATLVTRAVSQPDKEYRVVLDWEEFDRSQLVEEVELAIQTSPRTKGLRDGTDILIEGVRLAWKPGDVKRLARSLLLLTDPFENAHGFRARLESAEFAEIAKRARAGYFSECDYHLVARIDPDGRGDARVLTAAGETLFQAEHSQLADSDRAAYLTPPLTFELWEVLLDAKRVSTKTAKLAEVKKWMDAFGGVRIYHRGVRVGPYGDEKNDWLDMNLRRVRSPEHRPSTNNSIGRICVEDPEGRLKQKTDRLGFLDNEPFRELVQFASDALEWMSTERLRHSEKKRRSRKKEVDRKKHEAKAEVARVIEALPRTVRTKVEQAIGKLQEAQIAEVELLTDETQLYHTLGTVGTTAAAFAHQTDKPLRLIQTEADGLEHMLRNPRQRTFPEMSQDAVDRIRRAARALLSFSQITLRLLEHEKRHKGRLEVHGLIRETIELLRPYFELRHVRERYEFEEVDLWTWGSRAAFEAILTNLITNSLQAFARGDLVSADATPDDAGEQRVILFRTKLHSRRIRLTVMDNGPGITGISVDDIWLPGKTTTERGTGIGLTIVKDVIADLGGSVEAVARGELGGAQFILELPAKGL